MPLNSEITTLLRGYLAEHPRGDERDAPLFPAFRLTTPPPSSTSAMKAPPEQVRADRQAHTLAALSVDEAERRLVLRLV